jgi:branched-chain amino acid transport system permease protein
MRIVRKPKLWFAAGVVIFGLIPVFVQSPYYLDLFIITIVNAVLAMSFVLLLRTGLINMGVIAFFGIGAYVCAVLTVKYQLSFWVALPLAVIISAVVALLLGFLLIGSGSSGFSFVMLSAVVGMLFSVLVGNLKYLGGYSGINLIPAPGPIPVPFSSPIKFDSKVPFFYLALIIGLVIILVLNAFYKRWTGRAWTAIGLNPRLAQTLGINLFRYKLLAFVLGSTMCGLIGCFYGCYETYVSPDAYGMWMNIYVQLFAILGGLGYAILGPLVGAGIMTFLPEVLRVTNERAPIITGALLILVILFLPRGLLSLTERRPNEGRGAGYPLVLSRSARAAMARIRGPGKT